MNNPSGGIFPFRSGRTRSSRRSCSRCLAPRGRLRPPAGARPAGTSARGRWKPRLAQRPPGPRKRGGLSRRLGPRPFPVAGRTTIPHYRLGVLLAYLRLGPHETAGRRSRRQMETACRPRRRSPGPHLPLPGLQGCRVLWGFVWYIHGGIRKFRHRVCNPATLRQVEPHLLNSIGLLPPFVPPLGVFDVGPKPCRGDRLPQVVLGLGPSLLGQGAVPVVRQGLNPCRQRVHLSQARRPCRTWGDRRSCSTRAR